MKTQRRGKMKNQEQITTVNEEALYAFTEMLLPLFFFPISADFRKDKHIFS
jgi:hypothetical protein